MKPTITYILLLSSACVVEIILQAGIISASATTSALQTITSTTTATTTTSTTPPETTTVIPTTTTSETTTITIPTTSATPTTTMPETTTITTSPTLTPPPPPPTTTTATTSKTTTSTYVISTSGRTSQTSSTVTGEFSCTYIEIPGVAPDPNSGSTTTFDEPSLESCQSLCTATEDCTGVTFDSSSGYCDIYRFHGPADFGSLSFYNKSCSTQYYFPVVSISLSEYNTKVGNNLTIPCDVSSISPVTNVFWQRNNGTGLESIIVNGVDFSGSTPSNPSLTIIWTATSDSGTYICLASNNYGTRSDSTNVTIIDNLLCGLRCSN